MYHNLVITVWIIKNNRNDCKYLKHDEKFLDELGNDNEWPSRLKSIGI